MDKNLEYIYTDAEMSRIFDVAVWPQLPRLSVEGTSAPTALLTLIHTWSSYRRYLPLMLKSSALHTDYPLSAVMKLLASPLCKVAVGTTIMNIIENILDFNSSTSTSMDVDNTLAIPVGEIIAVDDSAGSYEVGMLIPHLPVVISYIKDRVSKATIKGTNQNAFPMKELNILSVCSQYVDSPDLCTSLLSQLLPFLTSGSSRLSEEIQCGIVRTLGSLARKSDDVHKQLIKLLVLCSTLTLRLVRTEMVKMFDSLADISKECKEVAEFVREVNAFDRNRLEEPDYDSRLGAFREVVWWDYEKCPQSLLVAIIHNSYYTLRYVDDMALRDSSAATLQTLVKKMADVHYEVCVNSHLAPLVRIGIQLRKDTIRSEFIAVLRDMVNSKPDLYTDMVGLTNSDNIDDDFWENIRHIQVSRRLKGLNRLMRHLDTVQMKNTTLTKYLLPLVFSFIKDESEYNKKSAMVDVCIATVGALCKHLPWSAYKSQLKVSLSFLSKADKSKMAVRLICTILDSFHFDVSQSQYVETQVGKHLTTDTATSKKQKSGDSTETRVAADEKPTEQPVLTLSAIEGAEASSMDVTETSEDVDEGIDMDSETQEMKQVSETEGEGASVSTVIKCPPVLATSIHSYVIGSILPQLHQILSQKSSSDDQHKENRSLHPDQEEIQRVPLAIAIVKLLQKISSDTLGRHLPSVLAKVCYFLKSRAEDIRDAGRQTLAKILACLGLSYMPTITQQLKSTLVRGYQVYILAYSLHYILNQNIKIIKPGDLNSCLYDLVWINMNGLFGSSSQEKDIDKHDASKEKRKPPHFELFDLLARFVTPSTIAVILMPIKEKLDMIHKAKDMSKIRQCLDRIADGLLRNTGLLAQHYLKFTHSLISDSISQFFMDKRARQKAAAEAKRLAKEKEEVNLKYSKDTFIIPAEPGRSQPLPPTLKKSNKHVMVEFGMKLFHMLVKNAKILYNNEEHARMVDPFVQPFIEALTAENLPVINESLICLTFIIKFKGLPSLIDSMDKIISSLFLLLNTYSSSGVSSGESHELCQLCFRFISMVLKTCSYYQWTEDKIEVLLTYAEADILDHYKQATAFSLLKAIISRKLLCKLLYEVIKKVETLSITSESADVRLHCRQVVLQFLLDYPLGKGLPKHINFFLENLDYKAVHGRESIYEMLGAMLTAFPQKTVHMFSSLLFISLARARINDDSEKCRKLASLCVRTLLGRVERNCRNKLFDMAFTWLQEDRAEIVQMAAQVLGLFIVVECDSFSSRFPQLLTVLEKSLQPQIYVTLEGESDASKDLQLYNIILMVLKLIRECPQVLKQPIFDQILEHIRQHMLHPHAWVRLSTAQVFGLVFSTYNPDELVAAVLSQSYAHTAEVGESSHNSSEDRTSPSHREALTFLLTDTRQKLRDFTADFCTQLSSPYMTDEFASQIAKNLVFLVKVIRRLPESKLSPDSCVNPEDSAPADDCNDLAEADELANHSNKKKSVSVDWLIRRLGKVATFEATNAPRQTVKRTNVLKCLAAIAMELGPELLQQHLKNILPPIHRELNMVRLFPETEELRNLAGEVSNLLKDKVGVSTYSSVYASVHQASTMKKTERKRKLAQQAVVNPSIVANKKMKLHGKKGTSKRMSQKQSRFKGNKVVKRKRTVARDIAILQ